MEHIILKIHQERESLSKEDLEHIYNCKLCLNEYKIMNFIEKSIEELPIITTNVKTEEILYKTIYKPRDTIANIFILILVILSFFSLAFYSLNHIYLYPTYMDLYLNIFSIFLYFILISIVSFKILIISKKKIENYSEKIDAYIEKKLMQF
ncbi:MAG: hypothetical protein ACK4UJ_07605 [Leptonema sp. (in: bacteria)]